mmetsp:Transcript_1695/g.3087  ORF Transcript_1695/g.3087 Transcript_1695/m.3087 type:complete len:275 (-) Transcript_1695:3-827(-)
MQSQHLCLVLEFVYHFFDGTNLHTGGARRWFSNFHNLQTRGNVHAQILDVNGFEWLLLGLHNLWQFCIPRLIQPQVAGKYAGDVQLQVLHSGVGFAGELHLVVGDLHTARESTLWPVHERCQHLWRSTGIVIDGLLAHDDHIRLHLLSDLLQNLCHCDGFNLSIVGRQLDVDGLVGTHGQNSRTENIRRLWSTNRDDCDFTQDLLLLHSNCLLNCDLVKRIARVLHVVLHYTKLVRSDSHLHGVVNHTLHSNQSLHLVERSSPHDVCVEKLEKK